MTGAELPAIVCGVDEHYLPALTVLMRSIAATHVDSCDRLRVIVLTNGLTSAGCALVRETGRVCGLSTEIRPVGQRSLRHARVSGWVSAAVYLRLAIADVIIDEPRVLYLDTDVLVLRDLTRLFRHPLHGAPLGAVRDPQNPTVGKGLALPNCAALGIPSGREYFNSGVLLLDLETCRREGVFEAAYQFLIDYPEEVQFWDQDALNVAVGDRWTRLDPCWNTFALSPLAARPGFVHHAETTMPLARLLCDEYLAAILHFAGPDKPWSAQYPSGPLRDLYRRFAALDALAGTR